jgi:predicted lipase
VGRGCGEWVCDTHTPYTHTTPHIHTDTHHTPYTHTPYTHIIFTGIQGHVHEGFLDLAAQLFDPIRQEIEAHPDVTRVTFTGHSL